MKAIKNSKQSRVRKTTHTMNVVCCICRTAPQPTNTPGTWQCDCVYDPQSGVGHWDKPQLIIAARTNRKYPTRRI